MKSNRQNIHDKWSSLEGEARSVLEEIQKKWERLIHRQTTREQEVHHFLETHAHLFFRDAGNICAVVSKLRFGAEFVSDFVVAYDCRSDGVHYHLVELERPDMSPFTKQGNPSAQLTRAIQQTLSWKAWLTKHPAEANELFRSSARALGGRTSFSYGIFIGTRVNTAAWVERRNVLADSVGIEIRSFDSLTDRLKNPVSFDDYSAIGNEKHECSLDTRNRLACPFLKALTDGEWRELLSRQEASFHITYHFREDLLRLRQENQFLDRFRAVGAKRKDR